jgi:hypothetical protein
MNIPLKVLVDAVKALEMLRVVADTELSTDQYMQGLKAWSALHAHVNEITQSLDVEVTQ